MTLTRETLIRGLKNVLTLALAALAALVLWHLYDYYTYAPQTRDGKLRADVAPLAADVSGRVDSVAIHDGQRSEEHTSELQSLMRISYAVFCLKKKTLNKNNMTTSSTIYKPN